MGQRAVPIRQVERAAIALLLEALDESGLSRRALAEKAGVQRTRTASILNGDVTCSLSDFVDLCTALGLRASAVLREAESRQALAGAAPTNVTPLRPATTPSTPSPPALNKAAARTIHHRPQWEATRQWDNIGEESQDTDDEA